MHTKSPSPLAGEGLFSDPAPTLAPAPSVASSRPTRLLSYIGLGHGMTALRNPTGRFHGGRV
ncbi:hypothetical protein A6A40_28455 (plasmid) [Azospirillum humicireducens]|uniref:Uncharacterized protein n=1 Tax=Azospirillum humicireducens TaxID=1226968 RepID=A0A2R4VWX6_9PROT|nr:hypothetical protein A6A40_28455 [Azospirillum humicireducens]